MSDGELTDLRRDYARETLSRSSVAHSPFVQFSKWMDEVLTSQIIDPNAMMVSTVDAQCRPSSRVVLLKDFDESGFTFFTNYESQKGRDLAANQNIVLHFFWPELERQINISGAAAKTSREESEAYFKSRPFESRIGAWASSQSSVLRSREELENRVEELRTQYADGNVPLPPFWGGFRVTPFRFEFWQGRPSRLHDRICYNVNGDTWKIERLYP
ncbi:MAG: pyridoxamine 5'-phosphate oxidase [Acidobacteriota bacterium]